MMKRKPQHHETQITAFLTLVGIVLALSACGGGSSSSDSTTSAAAHNAEVVEHAEGKYPSKEAIEEKLDKRFEFQNGFEKPMTFEIGAQEFCWIQRIYTGTDQVKAHAKDPATLLSPDEEEAVTVGWYEGATEAECLKYVNELIEW